MYQPLIEGEKDGEGSTSTRSLAIRSIPRSSGGFHQHQMAIEESVRNWLAPSVSLTEDRSGGQDDLLLIFSPTGRVGDELPAALSEDLRNSSRTMHLAVIQDDEIRTVSRSCCPDYFQPASIMSLHVIPGRHELHRCLPNKAAMDTLLDRYGQSRTCCGDVIVNLCPCTFPRLRGRLPTRADEEKSPCCNWYHVLCWLCYFFQDKVCKGNVGKMVAAVVVIGLLAALVIIAVSSCRDG